MTAASVDIKAGSKTEVPKQKKKQGVLEELQQMREAMAREEGLFNAAQAALQLDVSRERIYELMELGMLTKYEFLGRIYLSCKELDARRVADIKAGRPPRNFAQRLKIAAKATAATDVVQIAQDQFVDAQKLAKKVKEIIKPAKKK